MLFLLRAAANARRSPSIGKFERKGERRCPMNDFHGVRMMLKFILVLTMTVFMACAPAFSLLAADTVADGHADVHILVNSVYGQYRYSLDIVFYSMRFTYNLRSTAHNSDTGETYVNSGEWLMDENRTETVTLTVINHSDTPVKATARTNTADFRLCGVEVERSGLVEELLPAVRLLQDRSAQVSSREMSLTLVGIPSLASYKGQKTIYATVYIAPASGYATNGQPLP